MKNLYSEEYYRNNWNELLNQEHSRYYINLEKDLESAIKPLKGIIPDEQIAIAKKALAPEIYKKGLEETRKLLQMVKRIENGESSFGCISAKQEIEARHEARIRLDFNSLQLKYFKEKYIN